jgi:type IV secretion system protein VirD4
MGSQPRGGPGVGGSSGLDDVVLWVLAGLGGLGVGVWGGAQLAALASRRRTMPVGIGTAVQAGFRLPSNAGQPADAWPPPARELLPGPVLYWACTLVAALAVVGLAALLYRMLARPGPGTEPRRRLGVDTRARLARPRDLAPMLVRRPQPGRLIVGRVANRLVATENRARAGRGRGRGRRGDRSAVCVIGPTRCGKTANMISGILEWKGPAILSSVRDDLLEFTLERRQALGKVKVFDPTGVTGQPCSQWSPLRDAATLTGAQKAARSIMAAYSRPGGREDVEFFGDLGASFLSALFYVAAVSGRTMADVLRWVQTRDQPTRTSRGDLVGLIDNQLAGDDPVRRERAGLVLQGLQAVWRNDERTSSGIYITAGRMLGVWQDPQVAAVCQGCDIDLDWLVGGPNTLYIASPLHDQARLAILFGGVLSDLIEQQAYEWAGQRKGPLPDLLVVLDEAANTPTRWLPNVASTCSGLGILLVTIWQSKAQIDAAYGPLADAVLTNHGTKILFSGVSDLATLEYASRLLGEEEVRQHAVSTDLVRGGHSVNESTTRVRLLPTDMLRQAPPNQALLVHGTLPPAHLHARPYYESRRLRALAGIRRRRRPRPARPVATAPSRRS